MRSRPHHPVTALIPDGTDVSRSLVYDLYYLGWQRGLLYSALSDGDPKTIGLAAGYYMADAMRVYDRQQALKVAT